MNFLYEQAVISEPGVLVDKRVFPSLELAKKYCNKNDYCKYIYSNEGSHTVWIDYNNQLTESINGLPVYRKNSSRVVAGDNTVVEAKKGELSADLLKKPLSVMDKKSLQMIAETESNCITIIYKCNNEDDKNGLNFSASELCKVIYSANPFVDLSKLGLDSGYYVCRLIFFIESKEELVRLGLYIPLTQFVVWLDNKILNIAGNDKDILVDNQVQLSEGIHSVFIDFGVDSDKLVADGESIAVVPLIKGESGSYAAVRKDNYLYERNPLLLTTLVNNKKNELINSGRCKATNFYKDVECMTELDNGVDLELSESIMKQFSEELESTVPDLSKDLKELITFIYSGSDVDYNTAKFMKDKVESIFIDKFLNMSWKKEDVAMFSFLLPLMSPLYHNYILRTEVMQKCADVESDMYKNGFCGFIESDITLNMKEESYRLITEIVDRRDYIFCTTARGGIYNFERGDLTTASKCNRVVGNEKIQNYLQSSKCSDVEGKWLGLENCKIQSQAEPESVVGKDRDNYYRNVFSSKDNIYKLFKGGETETLADFLNYPNNNVEADFILTPQLAEICETDDGFRPQCDLLYDYLKDDDSVKEKLSASIKKRDAVACGKGIDTGNGLKNCDVDIMFNITDPVSTLLYSNNVNKYCSGDPFNSKCVQYYENVFNEATAVGKSNMENREIVNTAIYVLLLIVVVFAFVFVFRKFKWKSPLTRFMDKTTTSTTISTNI